MLLARRRSSVDGKTLPPSSSRAPPGSATTANKSSPDTFSLTAFLERRDYVGALTLLRLEDREPASTSDRVHRLWWTAYCHFQLGAYTDALATYEQLLQLPPNTDVDSDRTRDHWRLSRACCLYALERYEDAEQDALLSTRDPLCNRLLYVLAHRRGNGDHVLLDRYQRLSSDLVEDQLALAFTRVVARNFQDAVDVYKRLLLQHRESTAALHVYLAMCYFLMDYNDVSLELLSVYLEWHPDSFVARNLKACNQFRLYSGVEAAAELESFRRQFPAHICSQDDGSMASHVVDDSLGVRSMLRHNQAIFAAATAVAGVSASDNNSPSGHRGAAPLTTAVLSPLVDCIPEARMNLVLSFLQRHAYREAFALVEDREPETPLEYIVKGVLHAMIGEQTGSKDHTFLAEKYIYVRPT
ncbi:hypothetical protein PINS_up009107 [Pythium insidiosum]|nr:hypothetical protein PINS_up009107 [Pythium insidiosum]